MNQILDTLIFLLGTVLVIYTINSAVRTFVLPRGDNVGLTQWVFRATNKIVNFRLLFVKDPVKREANLAMFAPIGLLTLPVVWLGLVLVGFMAMFYAVGVRPLDEAFLLSGSSLLTLGFSPVETNLETMLAFLEATIGLILIALLIAYLPTMYSAFSAREALVSKLGIYAGAPPSPVEIIARMHRIQGIDYLAELYTLWENWFAELEESHTTFGPLSFFRSPKPEHHFVTAAGAILDSASIVLSALDMKREPRAALCVRAGYLALRSIADYFQFTYDHNPHPNDPISITFDEFNEALDYLDMQGLKLKADRKQAYIDFSGWRVNYDGVLLALAWVTRAPKAMWSSDRAKPLPRK
jgi:hypothetical protein